MSKTKRAECQICGNAAVLTDDHVPPKNLFPSPRPGNLVTVRACPGCNNRSSKDDEYFRTALAIRHEAGESEAAQQLMPKILRSFERPEGAGFAQSFLSTVQRVNAITAGGLYVGQAHAFTVDWARIDKVMSRIVRGLYFNEFKRRLPICYPVAVHDVGGLSKHTAPDVLEGLLKMSLTVISGGRGAQMGDSFHYRFLPTREDPNSTFWAMAFFKRIIFVCWTAPASVPSAGGI
jgi:hypothetical protein